MYIIDSLQVTNQMVSACKNYITEDGHKRVWDVDPPLLLRRLAACQRLYSCYQDCFHQSKKRVQTGPRPFEISETYVFGKFSSFCRRLDQIKGVVDIDQQFSALRDSHIEGIETLATRLNSLASNFKKKPYNPLDHRKTEFNVDYSEFQRQISELEEMLSVFMRGTFGQVQSCKQTLQLIQRLVIT